MPDLVFLSESQVFQSDIGPLIKYLEGHYEFYLNSEDVHNNDLPLTENKAKAGNLVLWKKRLDPYVEIYPVVTASFTPVILRMPNCHTSVHVGIYMPTHGQDERFVNEMAELHICLNEIVQKYPNIIIFVRGDANVNKKNKRRVTFLDQFISELNLTTVPINHRTYHHFTGDGLFDSNIDIILHSGTLKAPEQVTEILCQKLHPQMCSHHDAILSSFTIPYSYDIPSASNETCISAPKLDLQLRKVLWSPEGILKYENEVKFVLKGLRDRWLQPDSLYSMSILSKMTSVVLDKVASNTNEFKDLTTTLPSKSKRTPRNILTAKRKLRRLHTKGTNTPIHQFKLKEAKNAYKAEIRKCKLQTNKDRDSKLFEIVQKNPSSAYRFINLCKKTQTSKTESLHVQNKLYKNKDVADGFYDAMSSLKSAGMQDLQADPYLVDQFSNYEIIRELCREGSQIPLATIDTTTRILNRLKKDVRDIHNLTTLHFLNAGIEGLTHFNQVFNGMISNVNNASLDDLNLVLGIILYKGHSKDKTSSRSYRTISTCPVVAKAIDLYIRDLYHHHWDAMQAPTQYQGTGSNHELAALLVTEVIQHSLYTAKEPVFMLLLDAESAFDRCLRQILCAQLYKSGIKDQALLMIDNRLASRSTVYKWDNVLMGPSPDVTGFEQGGINSSDWYKLYNNEHLLTSQNSNLGVNIKRMMLSSFPILSST